MTSAIISLQPNVLLMILLFFQLSVRQICLKFGEIVIFKKLSEWDYKQKMSFNHDFSRQADEVIFLRKAAKEFHLAVIV